MKSIIFFETNEIPWRVAEDYIAARPNSALARLIRQSRTYETICEDEIELDPWISWPTLHRGVIDKKHGIRHLGQSLAFADSHFPPVWALLQRTGRTVGVFGSLHSSSVPDDAKNYSFYVPDFFATETFAHPASLESFQAFNLAMTRRSARNVDTGIPVKEALRFGADAVKNGLTAQTIAAVVRQLVSERITPRRKIRRWNIQGVIGLDFFMNLLNRTKPSFATYYTNHVAAAMHRYWAAHFTGDWGGENPMGEEWISAYKEELTHAMDVLDQMLARLMSFVEHEENYELVVASSLGQAKVDTAHTRGFTTITDVATFMDFVGLDRGDWSEAHAMVPCISLNVNPDRILEVTERLARLEVMGAKAIREEHEIPPLSFNIRDGRSLHLYFYFENQEPQGEVRLGNRIVPLEEAGFSFFVHEDNIACSAHHIPEGMMLDDDPANKASGVGENGRISTLDIALALLQNFGVAPPAYMCQMPAFAF
jgi:hypothetical protein